MYGIDSLRSLARVIMVGTCLLALLVAPVVMAQGDAQGDVAADPVAPVASIEVAEAVICTAVEEREPIGAAASFPAGTGRLYCFTDLRGAEGQTVIHAWIHEGTTRARVELTARADRWRTWSSKQILPEWTGAWEVKVLTAEGAVLHTVSFTVE